MKSIKPLLVILCITLVIFVNNCTEQNEASDKVSRVTTNTNKDLRIAEIALPGMFCPACVRTAKKAFEGMSGVISARVDLEVKKGTVIYDSDIISKGQLIQNAVIQSYNGKVLNDQEYSPSSNEISK